MDVQHASIFLRNRSLFPVDVRSVRVDSIEASQVGPSTGAGKLEPGEYREVFVALRGACVIEGGAHVRADVVSVLGRTRTVEAVIYGTQPLQGAAKPDVGLPVC